MIDAHQHFWQISRTDCSWPGPELAAIYRDFMRSDYEDALAGCSENDGFALEASVLVQSQANDSDTDFLFELANQDPKIGAVVAWLDFESVDVLKRLEQLKNQAKLRGIRPMLQAIEDDRWIMDSRFEAVFKSMIDRGLSFDALIQPRHLAVMTELACRYPELAIVIDHAAKPDIAREAFEPWAQGMAALAQQANVHCKFSGLLTEASEGQWQQEAVFKPYWQFLLEQFGADRLFWGSDWPVVNLAGGFAHWYAMAQQLAEQSASAADRVNLQNKLFSDNAKRFYRID